MLNVPVLITPDVPSPFLGVIEYEYSLGAARPETEIGVDGEVTVLG